MYSKIEKCRICGNKNLVDVLELGEQVLTGVFPKTSDLKITTGPLTLVKCDEGQGACGLLQLKHTYDHNEMYGDNYGYRSGLNSSMVNHLNKKIQKILAIIELEAGDLVIDIGSNDSTTLQAYPNKELDLVGIDPTGIKFKDFYPPHIKLISDFFSASLVQSVFKNKKARVITSFSMFYDLEDPLSFMQEVYDTLADDGIWIFEQSYMPTMLEKNSFDTVCHEHLEFYGLKQIKWMTDKVGFNIIDVELNEINGGSFSITVSKSQRCSVNPAVVDMIKSEKNNKLDTLKPFFDFNSRIHELKKEFISFVHAQINLGKTFAALGASTKGNVLLQYYGLTRSEISFVGEVNIEKYGCFTPGTLIPIISEDNLLEMKPDYLIVLPWHFKDFFLSQSKYKGFNLIFPLPKLEIIKI